MVQKLIGKISKIVDQTQDVKHFEIELPEPFDFKAGQFINLSFYENKELYRRPLSISSSPHEKNFISLCVKLVPKGHLTPKLWEKKIGDEVEVMGPLGLFTMEQSKEDKIVFVATGTGIAPLRSMLLDQIQNGSEKQFTLIFGVREEGNHLYNEELEELERTHANFKYVKVLSHGDDNWQGRKGHVQDNFDVIDPLNSEVYICGLPIMVEQSEEKLLQMGMLKENIKFEKY